MVSSIIIIFTVISCINPDSYEGRYIIENDIDENVEIRFYNREQDSDPILVLTKAINGRGVLYDESKFLYGPLDREISEYIYGADSIAVIFEKKRVESHYEGFPFENSLTFFSDYKSEGNTKRYIITNQNFENAIPCDGNCD